MSPLLLRLVRMYGPRILKILNKQSKGLPKLPTPKLPEKGQGPLMDLVLAKNLPSSVLFSRLHKSSVKKAIATVKDYPNLFRYLDPKTNVLNAHKINKALREHSPLGKVVTKKKYRDNPPFSWKGKGDDLMPVNNKRWTMRNLPKKMSPMNPRKFKRVMEID